MSARPVKPRSFYLHFAEEPSRETSFRIQEVVRRLLMAPPTGLIDIVPGYTSILVEFDAGVTSEARLRAAASDVPTESGPAGKLVRIPVRYDGPDLESAASSLHMTVAELIGRHSAAEYLVHAVGFTPGFPFLGILEPDLRLPRRDHPRPEVPANTVAIAEMQTGIYPLPSPGGWHLLGTSLLPVYQPSLASPFLLEPGDTVRFEPSDGPTPAEPSALELLPEDPHLPFLQVQKAGLLDIVVDYGRTMAGRYGLARSGPLDPVSARTANGLLGNASYAPLLEINVAGPTLEVLQDGVIAFAGWGVHLQLGTAVLDPFTSHLVRAGDVLRFPPQALGSRGYLAVAGGFQMNSHLGSVSPDISGLIGRPLRAGDLLGMNSGRSVLPGRSFLPSGSPASPWRIQLLKGPQFNPDAAAALSEGVFHVASSNRMGVQLDGPAVPGGQVVSEGNPIGAVQVTPSGRPIILMNDRGTIGGYAKPAVVHPGDLWRVGQLRQGVGVRFVFG